MTKPRIKSRAKPEPKPGSRTARLSSPGAGDPSLPATYEEMVFEISVNYDRLSKRLKQIAGYALDHPNDFAIDTIAETARKAEVQPSALIRFAQAFGFDGFSDTQRLFQQRLLETRPSYKSRLEQVRDSGDNSPPELLNRFVEGNIAALEHLRQEIQPKNLKKAIRLLNQAEVIHIIAMRRAFPLAAYFFYSVTTMGRRAQLMDNVGGLSRQQLVQIGPNDCLFVASFSNYTAEVVHAAEETMQRGIPVIALTDHPLSPLTTNSSVCFHVEDAAVHDFRSLGASMCLVQTLVVGLGAET
jgi:DNA-binding MurR/RpiR family transcriptional regulator